MVKKWRAKKGITQKLYHWDPTLCHASIRTRLERHDRLLYEGKDKPNKPIWCRLSDDQDKYESHIQLLLDNKNDDAFFKEFSMNTLYRRASVCTYRQRRSNALVDISMCAEKMYGTGVLEGTADINEVYCKGAIEFAKNANMVEVFLNVKRNEFRCPEPARCIIRSGLRLADLEFELKTNEFVGRSCVAVILDGKADNRAEVFKKVCTAILQNSRLKYILKIVAFCTNNVKWDAKIANRSHFAMEVCNLNEDYLSKISNESNFVICEADSMIVYTSLWALLIRPQRCIAKFSADLVQNPDVGYTCWSGGRFLAWWHSPGETYVFNVNAALMLSINNERFAARRLPRTGNSADKETLRTLCKEMGIPLLQFCDMSRKEIIQVLGCLQRIYFSWLEVLFVCIMSHGDENDTIHTPDGDLNLYDDVVPPLAANASLKNAKVVISVVTCRGKRKRKPKEDTPLEVPVTARPIPENIQIIHSAPPGYRSIRSTKDGTFYIRAIRNILKEPRLIISGKELAESIAREMEKIAVAQPQPPPLQFWADTSLTQSSVHLNLAKYNEATSTTRKMRVIVYEVVESFIRINHATKTKRKPRTTHLKKYSLQHYKSKKRINLRYAATLQRSRKKVVSPKVCVAVYPGETTSGAAAVFTCA